MQKETMNFQAFLQGLYIQKAVASVFIKEEKYFDKPIEFDKKPKTLREQKLEIAQKIKERAMQGKAILQQRRESKG